MYIDKLVYQNLDCNCINISKLPNSPGDQGSIPARLIPKTQKMVLDATLLNTQHHKVWLKGKWSNPGIGVAPFPTPQCSNYWKGSLRVTLDYDRQLYYFSVLAECLEIGITLMVCFKFFKGTTNCLCSIEICLQL